MQIQVKMITGVWSDAKNSNPVQFQYVINPSKPWQDEVFKELQVAIRQIPATLISIDGYKANASDILVCDTWEKVTDFFPAIKRILLRDDDKHITLHLDNTETLFHIYIRNF